MNSVMEMSVRPSTSTHCSERLITVPVKESADSVTTSFCTVKVSSRSSAQAAVSVAGTPEMVLEMVR